MKKVFLLLILSLPCLVTFAQGDGPRTMLLAPKNMNLVTPAYLYMSSNFNFAQDILIEGGDITSNVIPVTYIRYFGIAGKFAQVWVTPIWGNVNGKIEQGEINLEIDAASGFADPYVAMRLGLIGAPALNLEEFKKQKQKFQLHVLVGANIPLGEYSQNRPVNLGTNRWAIRLGAPMILPFGKNPEHLFFLEMTPSLMIYTNNNAPFGGDIRKQAPLFILENHLSHNFTKKFWASADLRYQQGGQTETDGSIDNNQISQLGGGLTTGYSILAPLGISVSYGGIFLSEKSKGQMLRFRLTMMF